MLGAHNTAPDLDDVPDRAGVLILATVGDRLRRLFSVSVKAFFLPVGRKLV